MSHRLYNYLIMKNPDHNIFLIGPMGSGKTTVGKQLAKLANLAYFDLDQVITETSNAAISWIFEHEGEPGFRKREHKALKMLCAHTNSVIATGGGCITTPNNCTLLKRHGFVIYLRVSAEVQLKRIAHSPHLRPLFSQNPTLEKLDALNRAREPLYRATADFSLHTDTQTPKKLAQIILTKYLSLIQQGNR